MCTGGIGGDRSVFDSVISRRLQARVTWYPPTTMSLIETLSPSSMCNKYVIILCKGLLKSYFYFIHSHRSYHGYQHQVLEINMSYGA